MAMAVVALAAPSAADDDINVANGAGQIGVWVENSGGESASQTSDSSDELGEYHSQPACDVLCAGGLTCQDGTIKTHSWIELPDGTTVGDSYWCPSDTPPTPAITDNLVASAFKTVPLPPTTFEVQPPGGKTLVNFATNFFTDQTTLDRTVHLLGRRIDLRIQAQSYTWHFGDGASLTTDRPGAAYPRLGITHRYLRMGTYRPTLELTWVADYRVGDGSWRPVTGSVTISGRPVRLRAVEATPTLVGYDR